ncbi:hypothetical protein SHI21_19625 [Bacteriovorax sp. PP10]|uniref:Uncharacterized protein n=1 Tax=Bacteriovorax antarcticus TaxID=3088717 RepID=A0ABU5VZM8_9BACT|nr:hypothetical protein [Bacteriovorax sp. PP10]MEA9358456.1 hypothetical protein [Bacteriovorax sp. PP10]
MKKIIQKIEETLSAIHPTELRKNPKASAKALEIKKMITELKDHVNRKSSDSVNQGVLSYINPKELLEN